MDSEGAPAALEAVSAKPITEPDFVAIPVHDASIENVKAVIIHASPTSPDHSSSGDTAQVAQSESEGPDIAGPVFHDVEAATTDASIVSPSSDSRCDPIIKIIVDRNRFDLSARACNFFSAFVTQLLAHPNEAAFHAITVEMQSSEHAFTVSAIDIPPEQFGRCYGFFDLLKELGFQWQSNVWQLSIGSSFDRIRAARDSWIHKQQAKDFEINGDRYDFESDGEYGSLITRILDENTLEEQQRAANWFKLFVDHMDTRGRTIIIDTTPNHPETCSLKANHIPTEYFPRLIGFADVLKAAGFVQQGSSFTLPVIYHKYRAEHACESWLDRNVQKARDSWLDQQYEDAQRAAAQGPNPPSQTRVVLRSKGCIYALVVVALVTIGSVLGAVLSHR